MVTLPDDNTRRHLVTSPDSRRPRWSRCVVHITERLHTHKKTLAPWRQVRVPAARQEVNAWLMISAHAHICNGILGPPRRLFVFTILRSGFVSEPPPRHHVLLYPHHTKLVLTTFPRMGSERDDCQTVLSRSKILNVLASSASSQPIQELCTMFRKFANSLSPF